MQKLIDTLAPNFTSERSIEINFKQSVKDHPNGKVHIEMSLRHRDISFFYRQYSKSYVCAIVDALKSFKQQNIDQLCNEEFFENMKVYQVNIQQALTQQLTDVIEYAEKLNDSQVEIIK